MVKWGYIGKSNARKIGLGFLIGAVLILFCLPNIIPFMFIDSMYMIVNRKAVFVIIMSCLAIGLMEEAGIRGVFLPLLYEKCQMFHVVYGFNVTNMVYFSNDNK